MYKYIVMLISLSFIACDSNKSYEEIFQLRKSQYVGYWNSIEYISEYRQDTLYMTAELNTKVNISGDGSVVIERPFVETRDTLKWFYQVDPEQIVFVDLFSGQISNSIIYDVIKVDENNIELNSEYTKTSFMFPFDVYNISVDRFLSRQ